MAARRRWVDRCFLLIGGFLSMPSRIMAGQQHGMPLRLRAISRRWHNDAAFSPFFTIFYSRKPLMNARALAIKTPPPGSRPAAFLHGRISADSTTIYRVASRPQAACIVIADASPPRPHFTGHSRPLLWRLSIDDTDAPTPLRVYRSSGRWCR